MYVVCPLWVLENRKNNNIRPKELQDNPEKIFI
jgi:hypothetical protein